MVPKVNNEMDIAELHLVNECNASLTMNQMNNIIVIMVSTCLLSTMMCNLICHMSMGIIATALLMEQWLKL